MEYSVYWNPDYVASDYAFDTTRKSAELAAVVEAGDSAATVADPSAFTEQAEELIVRSIRGSTCSPSPPGRR